MQKLNVIIVAIIMNVKSMNKILMNTLSYFVPCIKSCMRVTIIRFISILKKLQWKMINGKRYAMVKKFYQCMHIYIL